jgi:hypothetical protein
VTPKPTLVPEAELSIEEIVGHLQLWRTDTIAAVDALAAARSAAAESSRQLESPQAVFEHVDVFSELFARTASELERLTEQLPKRLEREHADALAQIASNAAAEERRCLAFRDKWINRPLPYEQVRPLLNRISSEVSGQLADFRELRHLAARLRALAEAGAPPRTASGVGRRELFNRLLGREEERRRK